MLNERWWVVTRWVCCGCDREGLLMLAQLVVYCGYRGFGSAQVHWGAYLPTYLPPIYVGFERSLHSSPSPPRVVQLTWWSMVGEGAVMAYGWGLIDQVNLAWIEPQCWWPPSIEQQLCRWFMISASYSCSGGGGRQPVWWVLIEQAARMRSMGSP